MATNPVIRALQRGDIFYADLDPIIGSEQGGLRPVLIIQNNIGNRFSPTVIVAVITSEHKKGMPTHVNIPAYLSGLGYDSIVLLEQIRTLDKRRLRQWAGYLPRECMSQIDDALRVSVAV